ncbi:MAG: DVUA0089 family protein, partial [Planctomycetota bacterium]
MKSSGVSAIVRAARNAIEPLEDRRLRSASAPQLFPGDSVSDTLVSGGVNRYLLSVPAGQIVTIDVDGDFSGSTAIFDSAVTLRTTGGTVLASNTGSAEEANGSKNDHGWLEYEFDQGGDYYVDVSSETGDFGSFLLEVQDGDANDTLNEANFDWSTYSVTEGVIGHPGDVDIHEIFIPTDAEYAFDIDTTANISTAGLDSVLRVFDDQGAEIGFNDDGFAISELPSSTDFESYLELFLPAGTYYAGISAFNNLDYDPLTGTGDVNTAVLRQTGRYDLRVTPVDDVTTLIPRFDLSGQFRFDIDIDRPLQGGSFSPNWDLFNQTTGEIFTDADFTVFPIIAPTFTVFELTPNVTLPDGEYVFVSPGSLLIDVNSIPVDS